MATVVYTEAKYFLSIGKLNLRDDILKAMLVTQGYIPDPTQQFLDSGTLTSPSQFEISGTGYAKGFGGTGRRLILNKSIERDIVTFRVRLFGDNLLWNGLNAGNVGGLIIVKEGTSDSDSLLIGYTQEGGFPIPTDGGELQVRWNIAGGILAF